MYYIVQPGDTLYGIAVRFGVSIASIIRANNLTNPNALYAGLRLYIPIAQPTPPPPFPVPTPPPFPSPGTGDLERQINRLDRQVERLSNEVDRLRRRVERLEQQS